MKAEDQRQASNFAVSATIMGVSVVTIPLAHYADLLACQRRDSEARKRAAKYDLPPRSPIETDAEVAAFFIERFGRMDMLSLIEESRRRFGPSRTPSRTSAYAFWKRLRTGTARVDAWRNNDPKPQLSGEVRRGLALSG